MALSRIGMVSSRIALSRRAMASSRTRGEALSGIALLSRRGDVSTTRNTTKWKNKNLNGVPYFFLPFLLTCAQLRIYFPDSPFGTPCGRLVSLNFFYVHVVITPFLVTTVLRFISIWSLYLTFLKLDEWFPGRCPFVLVERQENVVNDGIRRSANNGRRINEGVRDRNGRSNKGIGMD